MDNQRAFNSVPELVIVLAVVIFGIEIVFNLAEAGAVGGAAAVGWRIKAIETYAMSPMVFDWIVDRHDFGFSLVRRFVTYAFVHVSLTHALFASGMLLALGKFVGEAWNQVSLALVLLAATIVGAVVHSLTADPQVPLVGAYPAIYGLIGAFTYLIWLRLGEEGGNQMAAFRMIGMLLGIQLLFGLIFGSAPHFVADVSGFAVGIALSPLLGPGGWTHFVERMRQRSD
jgi:rhomboid protease GluP